MSGIGRGKRANPDNREGEDQYRQRRRIEEPPAPQPDPVPEPIEVVPQPEVEVPKDPISKPKEARKPSGRMADEDTNRINVLLRAGTGHPIRLREPVGVEVNSANYIVYFRDIRDSLVNLLYPNDGILEGLISADNFAIVCAWLLRSRIDAIYTSVTGIRRADRYPLAREMVVPKSVSDVINSIGCVTVNNGGTLVYPVPEATPQEADRRLDARCTAEMKLAFRRLIDALRVRNLIRTGTIHSMIDGMPWWLLSCRSYPQINVVCAGLVNCVKVVASFKEFTPADVQLSAIVQNSFNGAIDGQNIMYFGAEEICDARQLRILYAYEA